MRNSVQARAVLRCEVPDHCGCKLKMVKECVKRYGQQGCTPRCCTVTRPNGCSPVCVTADRQRGCKLRRVTGFCDCPRGVCKCRRGKCDCPPALLQPPCEHTLAAWEQMQREPWAREIIAAHAAQRTLMLTLLIREFAERLWAAEPYDLGHADEDGCRDVFHGPTGKPVPQLVSEHDERVELLAFRHKAGQELKCPKDADDSDPEMIDVGVQAARHPNGAPYGAGLRTVNADGQTVNQSALEVELRKRREWAGFIAQEYARRARLSRVERRAA